MVAKLNTFNRRISIFHLAILAQVFVIDCYYKQGQKLIHNMINRLKCYCFRSSQIVFVSISKIHQNVENQPPFT